MGCHRETGLAFVDAVSQGSHKTVLLREAVDALNIKADGIYVDATFGRGGHSREILARLGANGRVVALDRDPLAVAAAAQFSLAELASGEHLLRLFPELIDKVIPVLRGSRLKYRKPANSKVSAYPSIKSKAVSRFREQYDKKGRGLISIDVEIRDTAGIITSAGSFSWYIQRK